MAKAKKKAERGRTIKVPCARCGEIMRLVAELPLTSWGGECACGNKVAFESKGEEDTQEDILALAEQAQVDVKPAPRPRSALDQGGSPEQGRKRLLELSDALGRRWGSTTALPLAVAPVARIMRLPFGILMLDWRSGGGLVLGRWNRLWGKRSTLKTTLCLRALRQAQAHCRHCKFSIVLDPGTGLRDCRCPQPRYWLKDESDYGWLPADAAIQISYGQLPEGAKPVAFKGEGKLVALRCEPPPHLADRKEGKKARDIAFIEAPRCEPMRCLWLDSEQTIDESWSRANGVDGGLVVLIGAEWAEQSFASIEEAVLTREFDFIVIDSTSVIETKGNLEKAITENATVAARASITGRFVRRLLSAGFEGLTARYRPTILCTSQVSMHGIGYGQHAHLAPTDGNVLEHALSLDIRLHEEGYTFDKSNQHAIYGQFGFEITKNKAGGSPGSKGTIRFWLRAEGDHPVADSDDLATVMSYARELGRKLDGDRFIEEGSGKAALVLHSSYLRSKRIEFVRVGDCERFLRENPTIYDDLRERVLSRLRCDEATLEVAAPAQTPTTT